MQNESNERTNHWLLPFTQDVDLPAIDAVLRLAQARGVTLIAVSLISTAGKQWERGVRLELIQQSNDFLGATRHKARRLRIPLKWSELYTPNASTRLLTLAGELNCERTIVVSRGTNVLLLAKQEMQQLLQNLPDSLVLVRLPDRAAQKHRSGVQLDQTVAWQRQELWSFQLSEMLSIL